MRRREREKEREKERERKREREEQKKKERRSILEERVLPFCDRSEDSTAKNVWRRESPANEGP